VRARVSIEEVGRGDRQAIVITELPFQVNKARLIERIAELVREKQLDGIASDGLRDESDKDGMRVVIELKRGEITEVVLNNLYAQTPMETVFGINMVALQDGQPKLMSLKEMLDAFIRHRREIITRRTIYDLRKARERAHILEGLAVALANGHRAATARARGRDLDPARRPGRRIRDEGRHVLPVGRAGAGHSRHAPEPPHRPGAGPDHR
jgi:DNA gyrase subunit A